MRKKFCCAVGLASLAFVATAGTASATTLGVASQPGGSNPATCGMAPAPFLAQLSDDPNTPYIVPAGGGTITQWQTNTANDSPGQSLTFAVWRSNGSVVGADTRTLPATLPANNIASFTLPSPITVAAGDTLAIYSASTNVTCYFAEMTPTTIPQRDVIVALNDPSPPPPATGQTATPVQPSPGGFELNLAATLIQNEDAGVTTVGGAGVVAGQAALLSSAVVNHGPASQPITFTDTVPSGLAINSTAAGDGTCSTSGQTVTCTIAGLAPGQSVPVNVVVTPVASGTYTNTVSVGLSDSNTDPVSTNNSASATLAVGPPAPNPTCVVPKLKNTPSSIAKTVLRDLGCTVKTSRSHSRSVRKGSVIKTRPGPGSYAFQQLVTLVVSSGPKHKHHK